MDVPRRSQVIKTVLRYVLAIGMMLVGIDHFVSPEPFVRIVPAYLPAPLVLVYVSGAFEFVGGAGLLVPRVQRAAAWGLVALYVAVFPANVNMAVNHVYLSPDHPIPEAALWLRLPLQGVLIAWAWWLTRREPTTTPSA
ncbi:MAG: DoxX family membrane protein [Polyangiaceae bacterium]